MKTGKPLASKAQKAASSSTMMNMPGLPGSHWSRIVCARPYAITCGVYGYLVHTRFLADDETALYALDAMKSALAAIVDQIPLDDDDPQWAQHIAAVETAAAQFVRDFP